MLEWTVNRSTVAWPLQTRAPRRHLPRRYDFWRFYSWIKAQPPFCRNALRL